MTYLHCVFSGNACHLLSSLSNSLSIVFLKFFIYFILLEPKPFSFRQSRISSKSRFYFIFKNYRSITSSSLLDITPNFKIWNPCGLLSDFTLFKSVQEVTKLRLVRLLDLIINCFAYVVTA